MGDQLASIFQAIEFIESHLQEDICVAQIAEATGYSLFHFMRKFNQMVHHTPYDYLIRRRLSEAAQSIMHTNRRIIDIGQDFCFNDQETFSRVFRKMFQMTPSECRKQKSVLPQYLMQAKTIEDLQFINGSFFIRPTIIDCEEVSLIGLMTSVDAANPRGDSSFERIFSDLKSICDLQPQSLIYELTFQLRSKYYFVGIESTPSIITSPQLAGQKVCGGRFVKMDVPESQSLYATRYIQSTLLASTNLIIKNDLLIKRWLFEQNATEKVMTILIPIK